MNTHCERASKLAEIGAQLKHMRETKDITLNQVTTATLIPERHLRAIEEGKLDQLPEPVYVRGFIRKYGTAVGLDGLAEEFPVSPQDEELPGWRKTPAAELRPLHLYTLYVVVIAGAVSLLAGILNQPMTSARNQEVRNQEVQLSKSAMLAPPDKKVERPAVLPPLKPHAQVNTEPLEVPVTAAIAATTPSTGSSTSSETLGDLSKWFDRVSLPSGFIFTGNKPVNVGLLMTGQSWVRIVVDGETKYEGVLSEGSRQTWSADKKIVVRAGNAAAVTVSANSRPASAMGQEGEVVERVFDLNSLDTRQASTQIR